VRTHAAVATTAEQDLSSLAHQRQQQVFAGKVENETGLHEANSSVTQVKVLRRIRSIQPAGSRVFATGMTFPKAVTL